MSTPYVDIHTHHLQSVSKEIIKVFNYFPGQEIYDVQLGSIGLHPWYINENYADEIKALEKTFQQHQNLIAIGEIGLDKVTKVDFELQKEVFQLQLDIAEKFNIPVIIHCVKAYSELLSIRKKKKNPTPWIFQGYNSSADMALKIAETGAFLSFGEFIFRENTKAFEAFKAVPVDHLFLETDEQMLYDIDEIYSRAAELKGMDETHLKEQLYENYNTIFNN